MPVTLASSFLDGSSSEVFSLVLFLELFSLGTTVIRDELADADVRVRLLRLELTDMSLLVCVGLLPWNADPAHPSPSEEGVH